MYYIIHYFVVKIIYRTFSNCDMNVDFGLVNNTYNNPSTFPSVIQRVALKKHLSRSGCLIYQ